MERVAVCDAGCNFTAVSIGSTFVNLLTEDGELAKFAGGMLKHVIRLSDSSLSLRPPSCPTCAFQCSPSSSPSSYSTLQHLHCVSERCSAASIIKQAVYKPNACFLLCLHACNVEGFD